MNYYALIENDAVVEGPRTLPRSWRNISGLNLLDDAALKLLGWLPVSDAEKPAYDSTTQRLVVSGYDIGEDLIIRNWEPEALPADQLKAIALKRGQKDYQAILRRRAKRLLNNGKPYESLLTLKKIGE